MGSALQRIAFLGISLAVAVAVASVPIAAFSPASGADSTSGRGANVGLANEACSGDVSISIMGLYDRPGYTFKDPPDYSKEDNLGIFYQVTYSGSCEFNITVELRGSVSDAAIGNTDPEDDIACLTGCDIADVAGTYLQAGWDLAIHPNTQNEFVIATVTVDSSSNFNDTDATNNSATSERYINIVNEEPEPTATPTPDPSPEPTAEPTAEPTSEPAPEPAPEPTAEPTTTPVQPSEVTLTVAEDTPSLAIIGDVLNIGAVVGGEEGTGTDGLEVWLCVGVSDCEVPAARGTADSGGEVNLAWNTAVHSEGPTRLQLYVIDIADGTPQPLATEGFDVFLAPNDGRIHAPLGSNEENKRKIVGAVAQQQPVIDTLPIYPTPTPPRRIDAEIIGTYTNPSGQAMLSQHIEIGVTVRNNGDHAINIPVELTFPSPDKQPERRSPRVEPSETATVAFTWKTRNYDAGDHTLRVRLLVEGNVTSGDTATELLFELMQVEVDASIVSVNASPPEPVVGQAVTITVQVRNNGPVSANIPVTLHFPSADKQPESRRPHAAVGEAVTATFEWRTSRYDPGDHSFYVEVPGHWQFFTIPLLPPTVDFTVSEIRTQGDTELVVKGDWLEVTALVSNLGPYAGSGEARLVDKLGGRLMYRKSLSLEPEESRTVAFTWKTLRYEVREYLLQVTAYSEHDVDRSNDGSDALSITVLTHRDITVGLWNGEPEGRIAGNTAEAGIRSEPAYPSAIVAYDTDTLEASGVEQPVLGTRFGVAPQATRLDRLRREAQSSAVGCVAYQRRTGASQPRAVLCPAAPALVR